MKLESIFKIHSSNLKIILLILLFPITHDYLLAQPKYPPPTGVYCSAAITTGNGYGSVDPSIAVIPYVKGILVRVPWDLVEPSENNFNWSLIDNQISAADKYNKKISLAIGCGIFTPQWVFESDAKRLISTLHTIDTLAVPWDTVFINKWSDFIKALGERYRNDTTISLVYITNSTANGFEMQLPNQTKPSLSNAGYTDAKEIGSWEKIIDAFNSAFPNHYLTNDFHPVNGSNEVADSVYVYACSTIGKRYGASAWWWTQNNITVYPEEYNILLKSTSANSFTGIQMARSGTSDSSLFGPGGMPAALQLAISDGICYWEIWNQDILNSSFDSLLANASCSKMTNVNKNEKVNQFENSYEVYPSPSRNRLFIVNPNKYNDSQLKIYNILGQVVFQGELFHAGQNVINVSHFSPGIYFIVIRSAQMGGKFFIKKIIIDH